MSINIEVDAMKLSAKLFETLSFHFGFWKEQHYWGSKIRKLSISNEDINNIDALSGKEYQSLLVKLTQIF